ncbi:unnamed protein product [Rotaria magnacalcarata]|uniref:TIR domain-containing protein n=1 Tax=Rotaria magnacalcarata TaxID=392030 RepID=A0A819NVT0_9BILA|nr:unnamed protein product [Rotaria magnacalcarata]CAF2235238.1 unnamed protein product [Rotaria magnacalcarata]CAF3734556.1 unnamed protein product [Rotaria magnacalcarata]CAF4000412.1 unnamed protein product [Rotaria magnacalcarata]
MTLLSSESDEDTTSKSNSDMPVVRDIMNELSESVASCAQPSNTSFPNEDFLIKEALALSNEPEGNLSTENFNNTDHTHVSADDTSGKRISIAFNSTSPVIDFESDEQFIDATTIEQLSSQVDSTQTCVVSSTVTATATKEISTKKQHIMISYNRSCENTCRQIRNHLKKLKYKVWIDVYDMHDNFIDGMATAIRNSYIVLMCINREYDNSFWCKKEAEDIAIKRIKFIPCFMEEPFPLEDWLEFLVGANVWIDFSKTDKFDDALEKLVREITIIEEKLATNPRETPTNTPLINPLNTTTSNPSMTTFNTIWDNFNLWIEENRDDLKRFNRKQSVQFINHLIRALKSDNSTPDDQNKQEFLQQLLLSTSRDQNEGFARLRNSSITLKHPIVKGFICIMILWAVRVVFQEK